jgi:hypothetical protein
LVEKRDRRTYEERPAVKANGTVKPSATPSIMSRRTSPWVECLSACSSSTCLANSDRGSAVGSSVVFEELIVKGGWGLTAVFSLWKEEEVISTSYIELF